MSNANAGRYLKEWHAERDSAGSKVAATPATVTEQALRLDGTVWEEAVPTATAEHAVIEKAWRDEKAHRDREINELATDLDTTARTHQETITELNTRIEEANQASRDNAAAETRATITTLKETQDALIGRIQPPAQ